MENTIMQIENEINANNVSKCRFFVEGDSVRVTYEERTYCSLLLADELVNLITVMSKNGYKLKYIAAHQLADGTALDFVFSKEAKA